MDLLFVRRELQIELIYGTLKMNHSSLFPKQKDIWKKSHYLPRSFFRKVRILVAVQNEAVNSPTTTTTISNKRAENEDKLPGLQPAINK